MEIPRVCGGCINFQGKKDPCEVLEPETFGGFIVAEEDLQAPEGAVSNVGCVHFTCSEGLAAAHRALNSTVTSRVNSKGRDVLCTPLGTSHKPTAESAQIAIINKDVGIGDYSSKNYGTERSIKITLSFSPKIAKKRRRVVCRETGRIYSTNRSGEYLYTGRKLYTNK